jgi:hypothetical protein
MPELEEKEEEAQVTYARFDEGDTTDSDYKRKLSEYVWENLPLTQEQKLAFRLLYLADSGGNGNDICDSSVGS